MMIGYYSPRIDVEYSGIIVKKVSRESCDYYVALL